MKRMKAIIGNKRDLIIAFVLPFIVEALLLVIDGWSGFEPQSLDISPIAWFGMLLGLGVLSGITFLPRSHRLWPLMYVFYVPLMATVLYFFSFALSVLVFGPQP